MRFLLKLGAVAILAYLASIAVLPALTSGLGINIEPMALTIAVVCSIGYAIWRFALYESPEKKAERLQQEASERSRRGSRLGFFARIGQTLGKEMAKRYTPTDTTRPCPTCGGRGKNRHTDSGMDSECLLCAGKGFIYK